MRQTLPPPAERAPPLRNGRFLIVVGGEGLSQLGDAAFAVVLAWLVLQELGSVTVLAGFLLAQAVPRGLLLLVGGVLTDRFAPRPVMLVCHTVRAVAMLAFAAVVASGTWQPWQLYLLSVLSGVAGAFFAPAAEAVLPQLLKPSDYSRGNAIQGVAEQLSIILGPMAGAALSALFGAGVAIGANGVTFGVAAMTCLAVGSRPSRDVADAVRPATMLHQLTEGLAHAWHSHNFRLVFLVVSAATLSYSGLFALGLPVLAQSFGDSALGLAALIASWGAGQLIGTAAAALTGLPRQWGLLIIAMTLAEGVVFILLGQVTSLWWAVTLLVPLGIGTAYSSDVALPTFIQTTTPRHLLGRISSVLALPRVVLEPVSIALLGLVLHQSVRWGFAAAAIPVLIAGGILLADPKARTLSTRGVDSDH